MTIIILSGVLGFLLASLIALFLAPPLWRKAVKVTTRKLLQQSPRMMSEGQADRDQMRAEFAITTRKMEAKIEQLREVSDTQLIELSTTEKKRERLLKKIKNLQTTVEDREELVEKLNRKIEPLKIEASQKDDLLTAQTDLSAEQSKKLDAQDTALEAQAKKLDAQDTALEAQAKKLNARDTALEAQAYELDLHKQKASQLTKELEAHNKTAADLKQEVGMGREKVSQLTKELEAHNKTAADLKQEVGMGREKVSQLTKKLETHNKTAADLKQEVGMGREKVIDLIGKIEAKDYNITQLTREIETLKSLKTSASNEAGREHNDNKASLILASAKQPHTPAKPLAPIVMKPGASSSSPNGLEPTTNPSPCVETGMRRPPHPKLGSGKKPKPVKTAKSLSLAERIRALQSDHPKSI